MNTKKYKRLTLKERVIIQTLLEENKSKSFIAKRLNRSRSTISREINKWIDNPKDKYDATLADWYAKDDYLNKRNLDKISTYSLLKFYVYKGLLKDWSPEQIAGRIKDDYPNDPVMTISYEAIYMHIYAHRQASLNKKLIKLLPYQKTQRRRANAKTKRGSKIKDQISIDLRPEYIKNRQEVGHWEGDLVIGKGQKSAIGTIVERKTRYTCIVKLKDRKSATVRKQFVKEFKAFSKNLTKTMTYDNGVEMAQHKELTQQSGVVVYFAHPYASWERGTNENTNGLIRRYFPKGTDFNTISAKQLKSVQDKLNNRPRKILKYKTPMEILIQNSA
jgi:IS30 family transposase